VKNVDLDTLGNTIAGAIGGAGGGTLLTALLPLLQGGAGNVDIGALVGQAVGGALPERSLRPSSVLSRTWRPAKR
jgi:hypothetical protein